MTENSEIQAHQKESQILEEYLTHLYGSFQEVSSSNSEVDIYSDLCIDIHKKLTKHKQYKKRRNLAKICKIKQRKSKERKENRIRKQRKQVSEF